jgi:NAD(P)-dependent dehydrogenase (short-subunit alcohol dehydrogenase family)
MCHLFAKRGAFVVSADISQEAVDETAATCPTSAMGGKVVGMVCDVVSQDSVDGVFAAAAQDGRRIDILVCYIHSNIIYSVHGKLNKCYC